MGDARQHHGAAKINLSEDDSCLRRTASRHEIFIFRQNIFSFSIAMTLYRPTEANRLEQLEMGLGFGYEFDKRFLSVRVPSPERAKFNSPVQRAGDARAINP